MRTINYLLLLLLLFVVACKKDTTTEGNPDSTVKVYDFKMTSANKTTDGGFVLGTDNSLVKLSAEGNVVWRRKYFEYDIDTITFKYSTDAKVLQNSDGGCSIMIEGIFKKLDKFFFCIIKTDALGNKISLNPYYFSFVGLLSLNNYMFIETNDKGNVLSFSYSDFNSVFHRALFKIDKDGSIIWQKSDLTYFSLPQGTGDVYDMLHVSNNEFALTGYCDGLTNTYFARYNDSGILISERKYAMGGKDDKGNYVTNIGTKLALTNSNNLLLFGFTDRGKGSLKTNYQYMLIKINSSGDSLSSIILGTAKQDYCNYGISTADNGSALIGSSSPTDDPNVLALKSSMYFIKLDQNMTIQKSLVYGENLDTQGLFVSENANHSYTIIGTKYGYSNLGKSQTLFIRTLPSGGL